MDVRVGGSFKMSFINFSTGNGHSFGGTYHEIKPNEFLKYSDKFDNPNLPGEMITSVWLKPVMVGTEITIHQENIPSMIPAEMCYLGWQESLEKLTKLVEPVIAPLGDRPPHHRDDGTDNPTLRGGTPPPRPPQDHVVTMPPAAEHPFVKGLLLSLPANIGDSWAVADRVNWLQAAAKAFDLMFKGSAPIAISEGRAARASSSGHNEKLSAPRSNG